MIDEHTLEALDFPRVRDLLAGFASTGLGKRLCATVHPIARKELLARWYQQFAELDAFTIEHGPPPFGGLSDVRDLVRACAPPLTVGLEDLAQIGQALEATRALVRYLVKLPAEAVELRRLAERIGDFGAVADRVHAVIESGPRVRDDASTKLRRVRREISLAQADIQEAVSRLLRDPEIQKRLQYASHTFHNDRLVLPVRAEHRGRVPGIVHRASDSGATVFVEPSVAVELNNRITNLRVEEEEEIRHLLWDLSHEIYLNVDPLIKTFDALGVLDLIHAKVRMARTFDMRCPALLDEAQVHMIEARHPVLLEMQQQTPDQTREIIPITYRLGDDFDMLVITGPNTGGKTVTLKTIGLLALMVQAGLPAPVAAGSRCGLFSNILIDIGDEQSMQQSLSTFSAHVKRVLDMLVHAGPHALVLMDELGAGTDPDEGSAIGRAVLDELLRLEARCVVTTHIGALKSFALTRERAENGSVEFDYETLRPTYRLRIGEAGASNAIDIAQRLGMSRRLVSMARKNLSHRARALNSALAGAESAKRAAEEARTAAENARVTAEAESTAAVEARKVLQRQQADFNEWVSRVAHLQPGDPVRLRNFDRDGKIVRIRLDQHRAEVDVGAFSVEAPLGDVLPPQTVAPPAPPPKPKPPTPEPAKRPSPVTSTATQPTRKPKPPTQPPRSVHPSLSDAELAALRPGDAVYAKRFHRQGAVVRVNPLKKIAIINLGLFEVEAPFDGLAKPEAVVVKPGRQRQRRRSTRGGGGNDASSTPQRGETTDS